MSENDIVPPAGPPVPESQLKKAFEKELLSLQSALKRFARSLTRNADQAEDLLQDTLLKALTGWKTFQPDSNLKAWAFTIMRNTFLTKVRQQSRMAEVATDADFWDKWQTVEPMHDERLDLEAAIAELRPEQRKLFAMVDILGLSYKEAAEASGVAIGTVKSRIFRLHAPMQEVLEGKRAPDVPAKPEPMPALPVFRRPAVTATPMPPRLPPPAAQEVSMNPHSPIRNPVRESALPPKIPAPEYLPQDVMLLVMARYIEAHRPSFCATISKLIDEMDLKSRAFGKAMVAAGEVATPSAAYMVLRGRGLWNTIRLRILIDLLGESIPSFFHGMYANLKDEFDQLIPPAIIALPPLPLPPDPQRAAATTAPAASPPAPPEAEKPPVPEEDPNVKNLRLLARQLVTNLVPQMPPEQQMRLYADIIHIVTR